MKFHWKSHSIYNKIEEGPEKREGDNNSVKSCEKREIDQGRYTHIDTQNKD